MVVKNFVQKCENSIEDVFVHQRFIRFSVGEFKREQVLLKRTKTHLQVQTGFGFAPDMYLLAASLLDNNAVLKGEGVVVTGQKNPEKVFRNAGFDVASVRGKKYKVKFEFSAQDLAKAVEALAEYIVLLKFDAPGVVLKMKMSPPKPGSIKEKFVTLKVESQFADTVLKNVLFDVEHHTFKSATIDHTFIIEDIEIPKEFQDDFAQARKHAKRVGKIKRVVTIDKTEFENYDIDFKA